MTYQRPTIGILGFFATAIWCFASSASVADDAKPAQSTTQSVQGVAQVWLVSTRCAPGCGDLEPGLSQISYWRLDDSCDCPQFKPSDAATFQSTSVPGVPTTFMLHGNLTDWDWAVRHGNEFLAAMKQQACGRPFRLVVWSWPADRIVRRNRPDVQMKLCRSDAEGYYLARLLPTVPPGTPLCLAGYSLGCRAVGGALQLLAGGSLAGRALPADALATWKKETPRPIRVMMVAAALDFDWLEPCCPEGLAPLAVERILVTQNCADHVLKWYSHIYGRHGPEAMGFVGPSGTAQGKLEIVNVVCEVGRKHDFSIYMGSQAVSQRLGWYTFLCDPVAEKPAR